MRHRITLGILAGGKASRLGGVDKAAVEFLGQSLLSRTLGAMGEGYAQILVSHNGDSSAFNQANCRFVADIRSGDHGPLAGIESLLAQASSEWLLTVPVDLRDIPHGLCEMMAGASLQAPFPAGVVVRDGDGLQPLVALWPVSQALPGVQAALEAGQSTVHRLQSTMAFNIHDIHPWQLGNLNCPVDFE